MINKENDSRLLILSCSQRKRKDHNLLPAIERYDGPTYRITRKFLNNLPSDSLSVWILSAEHALIPAAYPMAYYDRRMTSQRAEELQENVEAKLRQIVQQVTFNEVMLCMGMTYLTACNHWLSEKVASDTKIHISKGSLGRQCATLYDWLFKAPPPVEKFNGKEIIFRGKKIDFTKEEVLAIASAELQKDPISAARFESWYIPIGEYKVAPKWLFTLLTGLPVRQFRTVDARTILTQLGIDVHRI